MTEERKDNLNEIQEILDVRDLRFSYDGKERDKEVLSGLSFAIGQGESVGLVGANGAGKSTLLKILVGLLLPSSGSVELAGIPLSKGSFDQIRKEIGYVFQDAESQLFMTTVAEDVAFAPHNYRLPEEEVEARVKKALEAVRITHLRDASIHRLSGGEKKLAQIATILSVEPSLMLMDEPSAALDPANRRNLIRVISELPAAKLIASHDLDFIWDCCSRVILLCEGQIVRDGTADEILTDEELLTSCGLELPLSLSRR